MRQTTYQVNEVGRKFKIENYSKVHALAVEKVELENSYKTPIQ